MNEQSYYHWDLFRPQLHSPSFAMGASFLDIREEAVRGISNKTKSFSLEQSCALWSKDLGLDPTNGGLQNVSGRVQEYRKEKSRDAARSRRGKENYEFYELAKLLPLPAAITSQLDKASIIRLSISYLKLRDFCGHGDPPWIRESLANNKSFKGGLRRNASGLVPELFDIHLGAHLLQSLDGFAFVLSNDGRFLYISETVSIYLGLSQVEMAGSSIFDYVHGNDHQELADQLGLTLASLTTTSPTPSPQTNDSSASSRAASPPTSDRSSVMSPKIDQTLLRSFCIRMKSTLMKRGVHTRSSGYRVVQIIGQFRTQLSYSFGGKGFGPLLGLTGVAMALPPPTITELRIEDDTFIMRLTSQFKIIYCENIICTLTDWRCDDLSGKDLYTLCHPGDVQQLNKIHRDLLIKGQVMSSSFRFLNKVGGYIWVQLCCTSLYTSKTSEDQTVLAIFQTVSGIEHRCVAMDACQFQHPDCPVDDADQQEDIDLLMHENLLRESSSSDHISEVITSETQNVSPISETLEVNHIKHTQKIAKRVRIETSTIFHGVKDNTCFLDETELDKPAKQDGRLSRRKTDHPRKRRRQSSESACVSDSVDRSSSSCVSDKDSTASTDSSDTTIPNIFSEPCGVDSVRTSNVAMATQQTPQDLSLKTIDNTIIHSIKCISKETNDLPKHNKVASNSVHELEMAMSKHLPTSRTKPYSLNDTDSGSMSTLQQTMLNWHGSSLSNMQALTVGNLYTNRESVIRSSLSRRAYFSRNDSAVVSLATPPTSDLYINNDQLQLHIPHISVHSSNQYANQKKIVPLNSCYGTTPPSSVSPPNKIESPFLDHDITREYLESQANRKFSSSNYSGKYQCVNNETINELSKATFLHVPTYQYHAQDLGNFNNLSMQPTIALCESRPSSNSTLWYGSTFPS